MGKLTISFDFELGWGAIESGLWRKREALGVYAGMRPSFSRFCTVLDDLNISVTWATVGAMISNPSTSDFSHLPEPYFRAAKDFLGTAKESTQNGKDLLEKILAMETRQDIGSHSFSHTRFLVKDYTNPAKSEEMEKSFIALNAYNIEPKSFVFPVNQVANLEIIKSSGIEVARTPPISPKTKQGKLWERVNGKMPSASREITEQGLFLENGTMLYHWGAGKNWKAKRALVNRQSKLGLERACSSNYHFHLWLHPFNLVEIPYLEEGLTNLLIKAANFRDSGKLQIVPMSL